MRKKHNNSATVRIIILLILAVLSFKIIAYFVEEYKNSVWKESTNLTIAVLGKDKLFVVFNTLSGKTYVIKIPGKTLMDKGPFASAYSLDAVIKLGEIDKKKKEYFKESLSRFFGAPVNAFYENSEMTLNGFDIKFTDVFFKKTDLSVFDYFKIKGKSFSVVKTALNNFFPDEIFQDKFLSDTPLYFKIFYNNSSNLEYYKQIIENIGWKLSDFEREDFENTKNQCIFKNKHDFDDVIEEYFSCQKRYSSSINYDVVVHVN